MSFQHVDLNSQNLIESAKSDCDNIRNACGHLVNGLTEFFDQTHVKLNYGATCAIKGDLGATVTTLFGEARGRLTIQLVGEAMEGRYVFEKSVVSDEGQDIWLPIWAIRIGRYANVWLGDEGDIQIDVINRGPHNQSISAMAKSLLYRIAATPIFKQ